MSEKTKKSIGEKKSGLAKNEQSTEPRADVKIRRRPNAKVEEEKVVAAVEVEESPKKTEKSTLKSSNDSTASSAASPSADLALEKASKEKAEPKKAKKAEESPEKPAKKTKEAESEKPKKVKKADENVDEKPKPAKKSEEASKKNEKADSKPEPKPEKKSDSESTPRAEPKKKPRPSKDAKKIPDTPARIISPAKVVEKDPVQESQVKEIPAEPVVAKEIPAKELDTSPSQDLSTEKNEKQKNADKLAPAASATPDKDSAKSILPPAGSRATKVNNAMGEDIPVRIISRPEVNAAKVIERGSGERTFGDRKDGQRDNRDGRDNRQGRDNRDNRDGRDNRQGRDNRDNRDNRQGQRPPRPGGTGQNSFGNRQDRPHDKDASPQSQRPRTPRPATPRPDIGFGMMPPVDNDQSRKKKNKGRRTVDFSANESQDNLRRRNNFQISMDDDENFRHRRARKPKKQQQVVTSTQPMKAAKKKIKVDEAIRVADLARQMSVKSSEVIKSLFNLGIMDTINNALDIDTTTLVASEFGYEVEKVGFSEDNFLIENQMEKTPENQKPRPPVVTIMGHVDHGKTSLLDAIRKTSVTTGEAGGITQHIGAYHVKTKRGDIVFLDTPGHEAFTAMRARGAQVTDLVVLVVAADDGVMEQTREAINHSKAANVPILVAVNKIDKEAANLDRVYRELSEQGLLVEEWGGDIIAGKVSAKTGQGLDDLLELIALQAEVLELTANPNKAARGRVVEAKLDKGRGPVATVLIQEGTLRQGDTFICGVFAGKVRAFFNDQGKKIKEAGPSIPVEIQGFDGVPEAGEEFICLADEKSARRIAESRTIKLREKELAKQSRVTLETFLASTPRDAEAQVLNLVLKADVQGSLEAITDALLKLSTEKVRISVIHSGAGAITETDIMLAAASHAIIIGFNVRPTAKVKEVAEKELVDIRFYDIIYKLVEEIKGAMTGMLAPVSREVYLGQAEVRQTFSVPKIGLVAGCMVNDGKLQRNSGIRLLREGVVVYTGKLSSLRRIKDDVKEVTKGFECGVGIENFNDIKIADVIECFEMVEEAATL